MNIKKMTRRPTHPGEVLLEDVIKPLGITMTAAADALGISRKTLHRITSGLAAVTPEMAVRIGLATKTTPASWLRMQENLDLWMAEQEASKKVTLFSVVAAKTHSVPRKAAAKKVPAHSGLRVAHSH